METEVVTAYDCLQCCWTQLIGPVTVLAVAAVGWCLHRKIAARRGTLEFLLKNEVDNKEWRSTRRKVRQILNPEGDSFGKVVNPNSDEDWEGRFTVGAFLSRYEFIAVAIKHKAMDETTYKDWSGRSYVRAWTRAKPYIEKRRKGNSRRTRYIEFEKLAAKWDKEFSVFDKSA